MNTYLGYDIGTTNCKALLLSESGDILSLKIYKTPQIVKNGLRYLDIDIIERSIDSSIDDARKISDLRAVGFSSVGESVVPVKNGKAMSMPLVWYEEVSGLNDSDEEEIAEQTDFAITGVHQSKTYSFHKMTWMQKSILSESPDYWLPVSSYFIYRKTGEAVWDTSQAGRSYLYDIHKNVWLANIMNRYGIAVPEKTIAAGSSCGENNGIVYGLGGHDHYMGLFSLYKMQDHKELFYDSMGSSSVLAVVLNDDRNRLRGKATYNKKGGCLVNGFTSREYIVNRSLDYYGRVLKCLDGIRGAETDKKIYADLNSKLETRLDSQKLCLIMTQKDYSKYSETVRNICFLNVRADSSYEELVLSGYMYMVLGTCQMYKDLAKYCRQEARGFKYYAGGGLVNNNLFMELKATALNREINLLNTSEISALGAASAGICACGDEVFLKSIGDILLKGAVISPNDKYRSFINDMEERYDQIQEEIDSDHRTSREW